MNELKIQFPTERHMIEFRSWLSYQGEQYFMEDSEINNPENPINHFVYHYEDEEYERSDNKRYTPMPEDLVVAQATDGYNIAIPRPRK